MDHHQKENSPSNTTTPQHTIAVVAKCPIPGKSKTRLIPLLGPEGSSKLAKAMLSDVLTTLSECTQLQTLKVRKNLFYAPANEEGLNIMTTILAELKLSNDWELLPMTSTDLTANDLGDILRCILKRTRERCGDGKVIFLGMDSPELPVEELVGSLIVSNMHQAVLCPAVDGGYGMLVVPPQAPTDRVFAGIRWSDPLTALGQMKALTDNNIPIRLGRLMNDIDDTEDVEGLCNRLGGDGAVDSAYNTDDVLLQSSPSSGKAQTGQCRYTRQVLKELELIS